MDEPTPAYVWYSMAGVPITDELIEWPPDLFALANVILDRSEAFRFALALEGNRRPRRSPRWAQAVREAGLQWSAWVEDRSAAMSRSGAPWRAALGLSEPSAHLGLALDLMSREVLATANEDGVPEYEAVLRAANEDRPSEPPLSGLVRQVLRGMLEQRRTRQPAA
jgi:hypothetical protein